MLTGWVSVAKQYREFITDSNMVVVASNLDYTNGIQPMVMILDYATDSVTYVSGLAAIESLSLHLQNIIREVYEDS